MLGQWTAPFVAVVLLAGSAEAEDPLEAAAARAGCPAGRHHRTAQQVVDDFHATLAAGNLHQAVICNYAVDAKVLTPGGIASGQAAIEAGLAAYGMLFGTAIPTVLVNESTVDVVLIIYSLVTPFASIPDGSDTYVVRHGLIRTQAVHATIVFGAPSP